MTKDVDARPHRTNYRFVRNADVPAGDFLRHSSTVRFRECGHAASVEVDRQLWAASQTLRISKCCAAFPMAGSGNAAAQHRRGPTGGNGPSSFVSPLADPTP
ncbi:hypothetical protein [Paracoccus laeviglucosivorans]|uniref:hypothetical protein n=1 Tax=Paracoccus laeviglucosivorans TaxID=1197861 RepID=UPI001158838D|nr:hypothetical protein [Paracoccus laeviglucosivorans]